MSWCKCTGTVSAGVLKRTVVSEYAINKANVRYSYTYIHTDIHRIWLEGNGNYFNYSNR